MICPFSVLTKVKKFDWDMHLGAQETAHIITICQRHYPSSTAEINKEDAPNGCK